MKGVPFRRKREGRTNYKKRLTYISSGLPRIVIRRTSGNMVTQLVQYSDEGDKVLATADRQDLVKLGWKYNPGNMTSAYLIGLVLGRKITQLKCEGVILDLGLQVFTKGSRVCAVVKGIVDAGVALPHQEDILPSDDRVNGSHVATYAQKLLTENKEQYDKRFSGYIKAGVKPEDITQSYESVKSAIMKM